MIIPSVRADSFIIVDNQSGRILAASEENRKVQVASLTKVATAMVILDMVQIQRLGLSEMVAISPLALRAGGANPVGLQEGDQMTVRDLLYCSLLASDNIAATALAQHAGARLPNPEGLSAVGNFVAHMNALARKLQMKRTLFLNPTGLDGGEGTQPHSTAADMARLTRYAYTEADFPFFVAQQSRTVKVVRSGQEMSFSIRNTNELLGQEEIDGVKTGQTARAGGCLILSSELPPEVKRDGATTFVSPRRIHVVLLGSGDRFGRGLALTREGWRLYKTWAADGRKVGKSL
ncbi:MAG: hypothetical protein Fur0032_14010 [Terrimicrobiaceae bacterium]